MLSPFFTFILLVMERFFSKIVGTPVFEDISQRPLTTVKDLVIDPENGALLALVVNLSKNLVISMIDISSWTDVIKIHNREVIVPGSEILRVESVQKGGTRIFHNKVYTKEDVYLGIVTDFVIDKENLGLQKLIVEKTVFGLFKYDTRIFSAKDIVEILPEKIVVKADLETVKEKKKAGATDLAVS